MYKRRDALLLILLFGGLVAVTALTLVGNKPGGSPFELFPSRTSYSAQANGTKGLFTALSEAGVPVARSHVSFGRLPESGRLVLVISPRRPISRDEWRALRKWVSGGRYACLGLEDQLVPEWMQRALDDKDDETLGTHAATRTLENGLTRGAERVLIKGAGRLTIDASATPERPASPRKGEGPDPECAEDHEGSCRPGNT
jgi:hypothetical protein